MKIDFIIIQELYTVSTLFDQERPCDKPQTAAAEDSLHKACEGESPEYKGVNHFDHDDKHAFM